MTDPPGSTEDNGTTAAEALTGRELAALVVDALLRAGLLKQEHVESAIEIAAEEIDVRKALGDY